MNFADTAAGIQIQPECLILGQGVTARKLKQVLASDYEYTRIVDNIADLLQMSTAAPPELLVVTDQLKEFCPPFRIMQIKRRLKPRAIIGIFRKLTPGQEIELRSIGLIFLGNYETFMSYSGSILASTPHKKATGGISAAIEPENGRDARSMLAQRMEERLSGRSHRISTRLKKSSFAAFFTLWRIVNRSVEIAAGTAVSLGLFVPLAILFQLRRLLTGAPVFRRRRIVGAGGHPILIRSFNTRISSLQAIPQFLELLTGRLALVGTAMTDWGSRVSIPSEGYIRQIQPGIFSLWQIRQASRITHGGQESIDWEYVFKKRPVYDFLLLLKVIPAMVYRQDLQNASETLNLFGLDIANIEMKKAVSLIEHSLASQRKRSIFFVNPDCLNKMSSDPEYFRVLLEADLIFPDGIGLTIAGKLLNSPLKENINGTDMLPFICRMAASRNYSLFLLGGKPGIAEQAAGNIAEEFNVRIAGTFHGYFNHHEQSDSVIEKINASGANILLVAFGAPAQEKWISDHFHKLSPGIHMGVGGLFDFFSGNIRRAPVWMREIGLEWIYRILQEPGRMWRRYVIGNPLFISRVIRWKFLEKHRTAADELKG